MEYTSNEKAAKDRIKRERNSDAKKFDRIIDRAKVRDAKVRAQLTKPKMTSENVSPNTAINKEKILEKIKHFVRKNVE